MAFKVWSDNIDFDAWAHTNAGAYNGRLTFGGPSNGFTYAAQLSFNSGSGVNVRRYYDDGFTFERATATDPNWPTATVVGSNVQNGTLRVSLRDATNHAANHLGAHWRKSNASNYYWAEQAGGTLYLGKVVNGTNTIIASIAHAAHTTDQLTEWEIISTGNDHSVTELSPHSVTVSATDVSLPAGGGYGVGDPDPIYTLRCHGMRQISTATTGVSRSDTFDAGATTETADVLLVEGVSLNGGSGVVRISAVNAAGAPNFTTTVTLADGDQDTTFTTVTGRYWQIEGSLPDGGSIRSIGIAKGNDAGGGGGSDTGGGGGGFGRRRRRTRVVVLTQAQAKKLVG